MIFNDSSSTSDAYNILLIHDFYLCDSCFVVHNMTKLKKPINSDLDNPFVMDRYTVLWMELRGRSTALRTLLCWPFSASDHGVW